MISHIIYQLLTNLLLAGAIALLTTLCGLGLLRLLGMRQFSERASLAPIVAVAFTAIVIGVTVQAGLPIGVITPWFWCAVALLALLGFPDLRAATSGSILMRLGVAFLSTAAVLGGFMYYGLLDFPGCPAQDGWSYVSFGEYLRVYSLGTEGGLAPLYQYASHLSSSRYIASAMLALLIPPGSIGLDTQMMVGPFLLIAIFSYANAVGYVAHVLTRALPATHKSTTDYTDDTDKKAHMDMAPVVTMVLATVGGWVPFGLLANNYDNVLALAFAPVLFGLASDKTCPGPSRFLVPGLLIAAVAYIYPELAPLIIPAYFIAGIPALFDKALRYKQALVWLGVLVVALLLITPYLKSAIQYFIHQLGAAGVHGAQRPGEGIFPGLLKSSCIPGAIWGFRHSTQGIILGILLGVTLTTGAWATLRAKQYSLLAYLALLAILCIAMISIQKYDYGAYKALLLGWWGTAILLVGGGAYCWRFIQGFSWPVKAILRGAILTIFMLSITLWSAQQIRSVQHFAVKSIAPFRELKAFIEHSTPKSFIVNIKEATINPWLVYQFRDLPALFTFYAGYMDQTHVRPLMQRSRVEEQRDSQFTIVDKQQISLGKALWENDTLKVLDNAGAASLFTISVQAPNGLERLDDHDFFWIGNKSATLAIESGGDQSMLLNLEICSGPTAWGSIVQIDNEKGASIARISTGSPAQHSVRLTLNKGSNKVFFIASSDVTPKPNANGDPRVLLVGIKLINATIEQ